MNGNGHITLEYIRVLMKSTINGVVDIDGQVNVEVVVRLLEEELDDATIQEILRVTERQNLFDVVIMFV